MQYSLSRTARMKCVHCCKLRALLTEVFSIQVTYCLLGKNAALIESEVFGMTLPSRNKIYCKALVDDKCFLSGANQTAMYSVSAGKLLLLFMIYKTTSDKFCRGSSQIFFVLPCGLFLPQTAKYCHQGLIEIWIFEFAVPATRQIFIKIRLRILNQLSGSGDIQSAGGWGGGGVCGIWIQIRTCTWSWNRRPFISLPQLPHFVPVWDLPSLARGGRSYLEKKQQKNTHYLMASFLMRTEEVRKPQGVIFDISNCTS